MSASSCSAPTAREQAVRDLAARGTAAAIVLASGYGEAGAGGRRAASRRCAEAAGSMRLLGPNTIGLVNLTDGIMLSASGALEMEGLPPGRIALVSQSGGILGSLLSRAAGRGIGFSKLVSTGNEADLDSADFIEHLLEDDATAVIALYIEGAAQAGGLPRAPRCGPPRSASRSSPSRSGGRNRAAAPPRRIPARWPAPTGCTTPCSASSASSAPRPSPTCSTSPARWPAAGAPARPAGGDPDLDRRRRHAGRRRLRPGRLRDAAAGCRDHRRGCAALQDGRPGGCSTATRST